MSKNIVGLDIGNRNICAAISGENENGEFEVLDFIVKDLQGVSKGKIIDEESVVKTIKECLKELEEKSGHNIRGVYLSLKNNDCRMVENKGYSYTDNDDSLVFKENVEEAYIEGRTLKLSEEECVADSAVNSFYTEEFGFVQNPIGIRAERIEIDEDLIIAPKSKISTLNKIILEAGYEVLGTVSLGFGFKNVFLSKKTETSNVVIIDVGAEETQIYSYKGNTLKDMDYIPLGGRNISKDLAICLSISEEEAERLKLQYSSKYYSIRKDYNNISFEEHILDTYLIHDIIDARLSEIVELVNSKLMERDILNTTDMIILTGDGISYYEHIKERIEYTTDKDVRIFTKKQFLFDNSSIINSISIVKEVYDRLKLICDEELLSGRKVTVDKENKSENKSVKKRGLSKIMAFLEELF
ncbi:cell division FtsA domain-containing protein [Clostridium perfringens]|nr:cell division FtsA domain-containing protein [Clostridium perfringens]MDM0984824.1 cell division FtsA domain-containing protein [Clostridium perfringens]MDU2434084.1 cell division FtsA domain-containing protein [Clostridium perfringens]MDU2515375.1 cell division FtsA domain-containing protein [Clostridium perfringens]